MTEFNVVGIRYDGRDEILEDVVKEYEREGYDLDDLLKGVILLKKEPENKFDPNAIKVYIKDYKNNRHHIGYIAKEDTAEVSRLMSTSKRIDAWIDGGHVSIEIVDVTEGNLFIKPGDGSAKTKVANRFGCGLMMFILLMIIIIIFT